MTDSTDIGPVLDRLAELLNSTDDTTTMTSMRLPANIKQAASLAVEHLGLAPSTTALTAQGLRELLITELMQAALDEHFRHYPHAKPTLAGVAQALAQIDGRAIAAHPKLIATAAEQIVQHHPSATSHDVLLWAESILANEHAVTPARAAVKAASGKAKPDSGSATARSKTKSAGQPSTARRSA